MSEAVFPILGPLFVIVVVLPLSALLAKVVLAVASSLDASSGLTSHQAFRYVALVASSAIPLCWFVSASWHQAESGVSAMVCTAEHGPGADCAESALFSLGLMAVAALIGLPRLVRDRLSVRPSDDSAAQALRARIDAIVEARPGLADLTGRVVVSNGAEAPIATVGIFVTRVVVQTSFAESIDDEALAGALQHELEHVSHHDPLRYFVGWWALAVNPLGGWLLRGEHRRWILGREAHCDRQAVVEGASPTALAKALLVAAKAPRRSLRPALGCGQVEAVKLRLGLLLAYADRKPGRCHHRPALPFLLAVLLAVLALPHGTRTDPLDLLHQATERGAAVIAGN